MPNRKRHTKRKRKQTNKTIKKYKKCVYTDEAKRILRLIKEFS
jgi:hypothetical protein